MRSQEGMHQGDPLGPLLFAMVIQQLVDAVRVAYPNLALNSWYLDDGVIAGSAKDVLKALEIIQRLRPDLGMDLNLKKNELVKFDKDLTSSLLSVSVSIAILHFLAPRSETRSSVQTMSRRIQRSACGMRFARYRKSGTLKCSTFW